MKETLRRSRNAALVTASAAALVLHGAAETKETPYTNIPVATRAVSDRYSDCTVSNVRSDAKPQATGYTNRQYTVSYTMNLTFRESTKPFFDAFVDRPEVEWSNDDVVTRSATYPIKEYVPVPTMDQGAMSNDSATTLQGTLRPRTYYAPGSSIDIWKDETTRGGGKQYLNAEFCGRLVLHETSEERNEWRLDPQATEPLTQLQTPVHEDPENYSSYRNEMHTH